MRIRGPQNAPQLEVSVWITKALASHVNHIQALINSGATISAIDNDFTQKCGLVRFRLLEPLMSTNANGTHNAAGLITHGVMIPIKIRIRHWESITLVIAKFNHHNVILGDDWL